MLLKLKIVKKLASRKDSGIKEILSSAKIATKMKGGEPFFFDRGSKAGVLVLHGFTSTPHQFRDFGEYIASKGLTVYAPLIAGHGTSPEDLMRTKMEDWQESVKEAYSVLRSKVQKVVVIGNSFGGNLAFYLARVVEEPPAGIISLGTPIALRFQWFIKVRYYTYGWLKKYYVKPKRIYKIDYTDMIDEITYPVIPIKSLMEFFRFIKTETIPNLGEVKSPVLVAHANVDPIVHPKSAIYIYQHLGSERKKIYWFNSFHHVVTDDSLRRQLFQKAYEFVKEVI